jgi:hypoxanthine phosphoribosyltransferase
MTISNGQKIQEIYRKSTQIYNIKEIEAALDQMAIEISNKVKGKLPIILCVLTGGIIPAGNLLPRLDFPLEVDYIHISRYGNETTGSNNIKWKARPNSDFKDRTIVVVDDILDEGITLATIIDYCKQQGAEEIFTAVLIDKQKTSGHRPGLAQADFTGLVVEDKFVFGYGLDYSGLLRNAPGIFAVNE